MQWFQNVETPNYEKFKLESFVKELEQVALWKQNRKNQEDTSGDGEAETGRTVYVEDEESIEDALVGFDFETCMNDLTLADSKQYTI